MQIADNEQGEKAGHFWRVISYEVGICDDGHGGNISTCYEDKNYFYFICHAIPDFSRIIL